MPEQLVWSAQDLHNRWERWSDKGVFARMMEGLAAESSERKTTSLWLKKGGASD